MESPGASRIAAEEAWESEAAPESEMAPESEVAPALPESEMAPEPEERPSMLSRLASWRAPEPEQETAQTEEVHPVVGGEGNGVQSRVRIRLLECLEKSEVIGRVTALPDPGRYDCRAPPGRLGLAFKDATCVVGRVNATSALFGSVRKGDELVSVNGGSVTADDVLGVLAAQDDGATARALVFQRAAGGTLIAPFSGKSCVYWSVDVEKKIEEYDDGEGNYVRGHWKSHHHSSKSVNFALGDDGAPEAVYVIAARLLKRSRLAGTSKGLPSRIDTGKSYYWDSGPAPPVVELHRLNPRTEYTFNVRRNFCGPVKLTERVIEVGAVVAARGIVVGDTMEDVSVIHAATSSDIVPRIASEPPDTRLRTLAAVDGPGTTKATPGDASLAGRSPDDYYACHAPPGGLGLAFASVARQLTRNEWAFVVGRVNPTSALHGTVAEGDKLVAVNGSAVGLLPLDELIGLLALQDDGVTPRGLVFHRKGAREYNKGGEICCSLS